MSIPSPMVFGASVVELSIRCLTTRSPHYRHREHTPSFFHPAALNKAKSY